MREFNSPRSVYSLQSALWHVPSFPSIHYITQLGGRKEEEEPRITVDLFYSRATIAATAPILSLSLSRERETCLVYACMYAASYTWRGIADLIGACIYGAFIIFAPADLDTGGREYKSFER